MSGSASVIDSVSKPKKAVKKPCPSLAANIRCCFVSKSHWSTFAHKICFSYITSVCTRKQCPFIHCSVEMLPESEQVKSRAMMANATAKSQSSDKSSRCIPRNLGRNEPKSEFNFFDNQKLASPISSASYSSQVFRTQFSDCSTFSGVDQYSVDPIDSMALPFLEPAYNPMIPLQYHDSGTSFEYRLPLGMMDQYIPVHTQGVHSQIPYYSTAGHQHTSPGRM